MYQYLENAIRQQENGLYICELPTGYGKTYSVAKLIKAMVKDPNEKRKIIYLTTLVKNLPEKTLQKIYGDDKAGYKRDVLRIRSNYDEVFDTLPELDVPEKFQVESYHELKSLISKYKCSKEFGIKDVQYFDSLNERINENEGKFRRYIQVCLKKNFRNKAERLKAIHDDPEYQWIGKLYPAVFTDEHQVLLMTVKKFLSKNTTIVEPSYNFLKPAFFKNTIIFIDEFDATKETIKEEIIERALRSRNRYLALFSQIHMTLKKEYFSNDMGSSSEKAGKICGYNLEMLAAEGEKIVQEYYTNLSYKTTEESIDRNQNFLLKDGIFHTVLKKNTEYIRMRKSEENERIDISFLDRKVFYETQKEGDIVVFSMLRSIHVYLEHFRYFLYCWADEYQKLINERRSNTSDAITLEDAISTILSKLRLNKEQEDLFKSEISGKIIGRQSEEVVPDNSFFQNGFEIFEFEDSDQHNDFTNIQFVKVFDTPEKIILFLAQNAEVFGISATAGINTVVGNYNLNYMAEKLGSSFHGMDREFLNRIKENLEPQWQAYREGKVCIHADVIDTERTGLTLEDICRGVMENEEYAAVCSDCIAKSSNKEYVIKRYCNLLSIFKKFINLDNIQSMLYLGMALPKKSSPEFNEDLLRKLFAIAVADAKCSKQIQTGISLFILTGDDFDERKDELLNRLAQGEKIFIMSSYKTIGAGQNLQYDVTDKSPYIELLPYKNNGDKRYLTKDLDAIYLGDITHLTVNTYSEEKLTREDLFRMLFQIEELYHNGEIDYQMLDAMIKLAFRKYMGEIGYFNVLYRTKSVCVQATQQVLQAVGRMCRTFIKNKDIYIFVDDKLLNKIDAGELQNRILPPEMEAILKMKGDIKAVYTMDEAQTLSIAERISSQGMWMIRELLSKDWTERSMQLWEKIRDVVMRYPTSSEKEYEEESIIRRLYISSGNIQNAYLYSQYSDFRDIILDFGMNKIAFRNSDRIKAKNWEQEPLIYEMSEGDSGLLTILKYPGMKSHFAENGYACSFEKQPYMMSPVLFHNIYKGALGEVAGKFILQRERGIQLQPIMDPEKFEFFDFVMAADVYVDFKNWKFSYAQSREKALVEIRRKMEKIGAKRVYIINIIAQPDSVPTCSVDQKIVEIPGLLDIDGNIIKEALNMLKEEDYL